MKIYVFFVPLTTSTDDYLEVTHTYLFTCNTVMNTFHLVNDLTLLCCHWEMTHPHLFPLIFLVSLPPLALLIPVLLLFPPPPYLSSNLSSVVGFSFLFGHIPLSVSFRSLLASAPFCLHLSFYPICFLLHWAKGSIPPLLASLSPVLYPPSTPFLLLLFLLPSWFLWSL